MRDSVYIVDFINAAVVRTHDRQIVSTFLNKKPFKPEASTRALNISETNTHDGDSSILKIS
jgi:flagellar biosynthesis regulator FlbT